MSNAIFNELAAALATRAVRGDNTRLEKTAAALELPYSAQEKRALDPMVTNALLGAGAGGLVGLMQPKRKGRNALTYGLLGGLTGAGLTAAMGGGAQAATGGKQPAPPVTDADTKMVADGSGAVDPRRAGFLGQLGLGAGTARGTYKYLTNRWLNSQFGIDDKMMDPNGKFKLETYQKGLKNLSQQMTGDRSKVPAWMQQEYDRLQIKPTAPPPRALSYQLDYMPPGGPRGPGVDRQAVPFQWLERSAPGKSPGWTPDDAHETVKKLIRGARQNAQLSAPRRLGAFGLSGLAGWAASQAGRYLGEAGGNAWNKYSPFVSR